MAEATRFNKWSDSSWVAFNINVPRGFIQTQREPQITCRLDTCSDVSLTWSDCGLELCKVA